MRRVLTVICVLCGMLSLAHTAIGDTDIYHTPTEGQLSEAEVLDITTAFWMELCSVDISEEVNEGNYSALFGPGRQWGAKTDDDCWVIDIPLAADIPIRPMIIIHGTTGEVVYWQFRNKETKILYICLLPDETLLSENEAIRIANDHFHENTEVGKKSLYVNRALGLGQYWPELDNMGYDNYPVWSILIASSDLSFPEVGQYYISAIDGVVLRSEIVLDSTCE